MNRYITIISLLLTLTTTTFAQSRGLSFSGIFESSVQGNFFKDINDINDNNDDESSEEEKNNNYRLSYGLEQYANIRMQSRIGDNATFFGAVNLIAATGDYALRSFERNTIDPTDTNNANVITDENYVAIIELERLHLKLKGEHIDIDAGLMRMPFGYGLVWKPSDFLNPPNPLNPDARPRAVAGASVTHFPIEELRLQGFVTSGRDPFANNNLLAGLSLDKHFSRGSVQLLYALEHSQIFPADNANQITQRVGASIKADIEIGFVAEMLYAHNQNIENAIDGLSASAGFDYSLLRGDLLILAEYLYNGAVSSTSIYTNGNFANEHYIYAGATWRFSEFTNLTIAAIIDIEDERAIPMLTFNREMFQGVTLSLMAQVPDFENHYLAEAKLRLRF